MAVIAFFFINKEIYDLVQISHKTINSVGSILTVHIRKLYCWDHLSFLCNYFLFKNHLNITVCAMQLDVAVLQPVSISSFHTSTMAPRCGRPAQRPSRSIIDVLDSDMDVLNAVEPSS